MLLTPDLGTLLWKRTRISYSWRFTSLSPIPEINLCSTASIQNTPQKKLCFPFFLLPIFSVPQEFNHLLQRRKIFLPTQKRVCKPFNYRNILGRKILLPSFSFQVREERMWSRGPVVREHLGKRQPTTPVDALDTLLFNPVNTIAVLYDALLQTCWHRGNTTGRNRGVHRFHLGPDMIATEQSLRM